MHCLSMYCNGKFADPIPQEIWIPALLASLDEPEQQTFIDLAQE